MSLFGGRRQQEPEEKPAAPKAAPPPAPRQPIGFETVLGISATLHGDLRSQGNIRLDGIFEGTLHIDGNVLVGETARITADINARNISIAGAVRGNVNGNKVQLLRTGRVWGDITAAAITTEEGAFIDGKITMVSHEAALQGFEPPSLPEPEVQVPDFLAAPEPELAPEPEPAQEWGEEAARTEFQPEFQSEFAAEDSPEDEDSNAVYKGDYTDNEDELVDDEDEEKLFD
jgi:cytoskeletal protein CcmA (bactofilin family)